MTTEKRDTRPKSTGRVPRGKSLPAPEWAEIRSEVLGGATYDATAKKHGITRQTIERRAKLEKWRAKDRRQSIGKAFAKQAEKQGEKLAREIEEWGEAETRDLQAFRKQAAEIVKHAKGIKNARAFQALVSAYKDIQHMFRLRAGLSTSNTAGKMDATVSVESYEDALARRIKERGVTTDGETGNG